MVLALLQMVGGRSRAAQVLQPWCRWPPDPLPDPLGLSLVTTISRFLQEIRCPKLSLKLLTLKAAFPIPLPCYLSQLILNLFHNSIFSLLPPCLTTCLFLSIVFNLTFIYICVLNRHEGKLMSKPKIVSRMRSEDAMQCVHPSVESRPGKSC